VEAALPDTDLVILSDYGKGTLTRPVIEAAVRAARAKGIPILVDPKGSDFAKYRGATLVTPNRKEAEGALGRPIASLDDLPGAADELIETAGLDLTLITLGAEGIYFKTRAGTDAPVTEGRIPTQARAVFDVTGAGDTVVSHLAFHLALGVELEAAVALANHAAGIVVAKLGTHSVTRAELFDRLMESLPHEGKVVPRDGIGAVVEGLRRQSKRIVFTNGCFDVLHAGHVEYLRFARSKGDVLVVGVNDDESVSRLKGPTRPVNGLADRMTVLAALESVDIVLPFTEDTPENLVRDVTPDILVKGEDYKDKLVVGADWVESHGGQVVLAPFLAGRSTTTMLERARSSENS
ncbi:MAG: D-glycero-beta-D-manno-heptose 1-phosphate adenylyltransferase, partial [Planctomycetota bacterium]